VTQNARDALTWTPSERRFDSTVVLAIVYQTTRSVRRVARALPGTAYKDH